MASVDRQRAALLKARQRRIELEVARAAKERRAGEATDVVRVRQRELADAEAAADRARAGLGSVLRQLVTDTDLDRACAIGGLTRTEVRSLIRFAAKAHTSMVTVGPALGSSPGPRWS